MILIWFKSNIELKIKYTYSKESMGYKILRGWIKQLGNKDYKNIIWLGEVDFMKFENISKLDNEMANNPSRLLTWHDTINLFIF